LRKSHKKQNLLVVFASYFFYAWFDWRFVFLLLFSTALDFYFGIIIDHARQHQQSGDKRNLAKLTLVVSVICNLTVLGFFKYFDFFTVSAMQLGASIGIELSLPVLQIILPAGISFYTFQSLSYIFDIYDRKLRATYKFSDYAFYVSFFPHLVAGPILRATDIMPKILRPRVMSVQKILSGLQLVIYGLFCKLVIADNMALIVNGTFRNPSPSGGAIIIATYAFAFQIYCDFLGYTNIARGIARMMGIELVLNFNLPYFSRNPSDFWRRWHISLSTWLRDYLYVRLGGNRDGNLTTYRNLMVVMLLGGLWHGAAWNFVLWGLYHGTILVLFRAWNEYWSAYPKTMRIKRMVIPTWLAIFLYFQVTCVGWLIFRCTDYSDIISKLSSVVLYTKLDDFLVDNSSRLFIFLVPFICFEIYQYLSKNQEPWCRWPVAVRTVWYALLIVCIAIFRPEVQTPFIYFQF
jgi:D-alanyl-lipoteichoic acid acyltransferase DltB (MBOAT superfamily)